MKIIRELLAELKRSNDLKEKEIDFKTMSDLEFGQKYGCHVPLERRQQQPGIIHTHDPNGPTLNTASGGWF